MKDGYGPFDPSSAYVRLRGDPSAEPLPLNETFRERLGRGHGNEVGLVPSCRPHGFVGALLLALAIAATAPAQDAPAAPAAVELRELQPGVWIHTSYYEYPGGERFPANGLVVRDGEDLILVDTAWGELSTLALLGAIENRIGLPVRRVVVTHSHYDRLAGADVLEARGITVLAHALTQDRALGQGTPVPDEALEGLDEPGASAVLGPIEIFYPGPGHAPDNLMVWLPEGSVLFGGCAVRALSSASLGATADADVESWSRAIDRALDRYADAEAVVPGHGETGDLGLLDHTRRLLDDALVADR